MKKEVLISSVLLLIISVSGFASAQSDREITFTLNSDTICVDEKCETTVYSYEKFWFNDQGEWEEIDENWFDCSDKQGIKFCTQEYHFNVVAKADGTVSSFLGGDDLTFKLSNLLDLPLSFNPSIEGSVLTYEDIIPNVDLRYQYLPRKLKEEIVIKQPLSLSGDFSVKFTKSGLADFAFLPFTICDARGFCELLESQISFDSVSLDIPISFFDSAVYPVVIDPTIVLNNALIGARSSFSDLVSNNPQATTLQKGNAIFAGAIGGGVSGATGLTGVLAGAAPALGQLATDFSLSEIEQINQEQSVVKDLIRDLRNNGDGGGRESRDESSAGDRVSDLVDPDKKATEEELLLSSQNQQPISKTKGDSGFGDEVSISGSSGGSSSVGDFEDLIFISPPPVCSDGCYI